LLDLFTFQLISTSLSNCLVYNIHIEFTRAVDTRTQLKSERLSSQYQQVIITYYVTYYLNKGAM